MRSTRSLIPMASTALAAATPAVADEPKGHLAKLPGSWTARFGPDKGLPITLARKGIAVEITGSPPAARSSGSMLS